MEKAYLAGLIDGEGYVAVTRARTSKSAKGCKRGISYRMMVAVRMCDLRPLVFAQGASGVGRVMAVKKAGKMKRPAWTWTVWSQQAAWFIREIRPYLVLKVAQADVCLEFQSAMRMPGRCGLSDEEWAFREECWRKTRELNYGPSTANSFS